MVVDAVQGGVQFPAQGDVDTQLYLLSYSPPKSLTLQI